MQEFEKNVKHWAKIARKFPGRTQHQIKNRSFAVLIKECSFSREDLKNFSKKNCLIYACRLALESLQNKLLEGTTKKTNLLNESNEIMKESSSSTFSWDEFKFQEILNFEKEEEIFTQGEKRETSYWNQ